MKTGILAAAVLLPACLVQGQVTITSADFFNSIGQYYKVYAGNQPVDVSGKLGTAASTAQTWDFATTGPSNIVYSFNYVAPSDSGKDADFPLATVAEQQKNEGTGVKMAWLFLKFNTSGRINYGFYNPSSDPSEGQFNPPIVDFPASIKYQDTWTVDTTFPSTMSFGDISADFTIHYSATANVDAFGTIKLPGLGEVECLRINELDQYETQMDLGEEGGMTTVETDWVRSYYFVSPGKGIVATITSNQSSAAAPAVDFTTAAQFVRMFEFGRGTSTLPAPVKDLEITLSGPSVFLTWSPSANTVSYRVEASSNPGDINSWQSLGTTTKDYFLDANTSSAAARFYRVVSLAE